RSAWDGSSIGCRRTVPTLTSTTTSRSRKTKLLAAGCITTTPSSSFPATKVRAQASSIKTMRDRSFTPTPPSGVGSTSSWAPTIGLTSRLKVATKKDCHMEWPGCDITTATRMRTRPRPAAAPRKRPPESRIRAPKWPALLFIRDFDLEYLRERFQYAVLEVGFCNLSLQ